MHDFDGTNPLLEALGDEAAIKEIAVTNTSPFIIVEPLTQVRLLPFEKTVIRVKGKAAYEQITANIKQLNALKSGVLSIEASKPEDDLASLPWLSSQDQAVFRPRCEHPVRFLGTQGNQVVDQYADVGFIATRAPAFFALCEQRGVGSRQ